MWILRVQYADERQRMLYGPFLTKTDAVKKGLEIKAKPFVDEVHVEYINPIKES